MCFSATASFVAGTLLLGIGIAAIKKVKNPKQYLFASMPLIFSFQQFTEGFVWLSLLHPAYEPFHKPATYTFLILAQMHWPLWVPFSIMLIEKNKIRKHILIVFSAIGALVACYLIYCFIDYPVNSQIGSYHIFYEIHFPVSNTFYGRATYFALTVIPPFISSIKRMHWLAWATLVSYIAAKVFFNEYAVSVWCFFAAIISIIIYVIVRAQAKKSE